jgi:flagellar assembly factor FliW
MSAPQPAAEAAFVHFPTGLVGLPEMRHFRLSAIPDSPLLALDETDGEFGLIVAPAATLFPEQADKLRARCALGEHDQLLVVLNLTDAGVTANLAGPLVIDARSGTGRQLLVEDQAFPLRAPIAR